jgi:hypothetical protein
MPVGRGDEPSPSSKRIQRRLRRYRTGEEGWISHLKRRYGLDHSRLKGQEGQKTWTEWGILAYNLDTLAVRTKVKQSAPLTRSEHNHSLRKRPRSPPRGRFVPQELARG